MSFEHSILRRLTIGGRQVSKSKTLTGSAMQSLSESIPGASTHLQVMFTLDVSAVKSFMMCAERDMTIKTNSSGSPDNTINLLAGEPYTWHTGWYDAFKLTADVTTLYATLAAGAAAILEIEALTDPTP